MQSDNSQKHPKNEMFSCPCGKKYLSYPALFTHVKRKHDGHAPGAIEVPKTKILTRRGRPAVELRPAYHSINTTQLQCLEMIELTILKICEHCEKYKNESPIVLGNRQPAAPQKDSHPMFHQSSHLSPFRQNMCNFAKQLCQHFSLQMLQRVYELLSWYTQWLQRSKLPQNMDSIENYMKMGLQSQCQFHRRTMPNNYEMKIQKMVLESLSKWFYFKGMSNYILQQIDK